MEKEMFNFNEDVLETKGRIVVDFYADWCGPCNFMKPIFDRVAKEIQDITFMKCNVDKLPEAGSQCNVRSIPTFIVFEDGKEEKRFVGSMSYEQMLEWIKK